MRSLQLSLEHLPCSRFPPSLSPPPLFSLFWSLSPVSLTRSLSQSAERVSDLERQLEQLLASKSEAIRQMEEQQAAREREMEERQAAREREMEERQAARERELQAARSRAEELAQAVESLERAREEEEEEEEGEGEELEALRESVDSLNQQLTNALEELEGLHRQ